MRGFATIAQIIAEARKKLTPEAWDYLVGGAETETTLRRNQIAFDHWAFRPRASVEVSSIQPGTSLLGHDLRIPVIIAPIGFMPMLLPLGAIEAAQAAERFGTLFALSSLTDPGLEAGGRASDGPKLYQLYVRGDAAWLKGVIERVVSAGYDGLVLTVDMPVRGRRERLIGRANSYNSEWVTPDEARNFQAQFSWDLLARVRGLAGPLPIYLKGVATAEDAVLAIEHGMDAIWVSNHGGRQLDHALGTLDSLPEVAAAVAGRAPIILDGGITRGSDVAKALALGADAVAIGKLQGLAIAAGGADGLIRALEILESEFVDCMALIGARRVHELRPGDLEMVEAAALHSAIAWESHKSSTPPGN